MAKIAIGIGRIMYQIRAITVVISTSIVIFQKIGPLLKKKQVENLRFSS